MEAQHFSPTTPWRIELREESGEPTHIPVTTDTLTIGRADDADIRLDRPSVSRSHARLTRDAGGRWYVSDLQSRGGTYLNGHRLDNAPAPISPDDVLTISRFHIRLLPASPASANTAPASSQSYPPSAESDAGPTLHTDDAADAEISVFTRIEPPRLDTSHIVAISDFGRELLSLEDPGTRRLRLTELVTGRVIRARWAMVLQFDPAAMNKPMRRLAMSPPDTGDVHLSRTAITHMVSAKAPVLATNFQSASGGAAELSMVTRAPATAVVVCPLSEGDQPTQLLYVNLPPAYGSTEWLALIALAVKQFQQAEAAWAARESIRAAAARQRDLANARQIQHSILPKPAHYDGLDLAWSFEPCELVGGDLVDVVPMHDGRLLLTIADVTGHGLPAALATLTVHSIIRVCMRHRIPLADTMRILNEHLCDYLPTGRFVTMVAVAINPADGSVECVNAGHPAPVVFADPTRDNDAFRTLQDSAHLPLGVDRFDFDVQADVINPGETLFLFTDGLSELPHNDGTLLGLTRLHQMFQHSLHTTASIIDAVADCRSRLHAHNTSDINPSAADDQTFLLARRLPRD